MTDDRTFVAALGALLAVIGAIMWFLDSPIADPGAQLSAQEGLAMAVVAGASAAVASAMRLRSRARG